MSTPNDKLKEVHLKLSPRLMSTEFVLQFMAEAHRAQSTNTTIDTDQMVETLDVKLASVIVHSWNQALFAMVLAFHGGRSALQCALGAELVDLGSSTEAVYQRIFKLIDSEEWTFAREVELREKAKAAVDETLTALRTNATEDKAEPTGMDEG